MPDRSQDWLTQAEGDLEHARVSRAAQHHDWACFAAQQAAEKAVKAVHLSHLEMRRGHSVRELLKSLPVEAPEILIKKAQILDTYYIPTRYANGHDSGAPRENYNDLMSEQAIEYASDILRFARSEMAGSR